MQDEGPVGRNAWILVVDDEAMIVEAVVQGLAELGFTRIEGVCSAEEALDRARAGARLDLLVTDLRMPDIDGLELSRRVREIHPRVRIVYISGYFDRKPVTDPASKFLPKPFTIDRLADTIVGSLAEALGMRPGPAA